MLYQCSSSQSNNFIHMIIKLHSELCSQNTSYIGNDYCEAVLELLWANLAAAIGKYLTSVSYIKLGSTPD